jgi:hypothetical protein
MEKICEAVNKYSAEKENKNRFSYVLCVASAAAAVTVKTTLNKLTGPN